MYRVISKYSRSNFAVLLGLQKQSFNFRTDVAKKKYSTKVIVILGVLALLLTSEKSKIHIEQGISST
jgi:hypothetical protein